MKRKVMPSKKKKRASHYTILWFMICYWNWTILRCILTPRNTIYPMAIYQKDSDVIAGLEMMPFTRQGSRSQLCRLR